MTCSERGRPYLRARLGLALLLLAVSTGPAPALELLKIATIAPEGSTWVQALRGMDQELRQRSGDALGLKIYPGGVQGNEDVMLRKIRIGQLHGGSFGGTGVSDMVADVLALEMPFLFDSYDEVDFVVARMDTFYRQRFLDAGYVLLSWADIGFVHIMSQKPVRGAPDIRGMKVWRLEGEPITAVLFSRAGVTSVPLAIPDVLLGLQTGLVDVTYASPSAAIVLQWFTRVKYYTELPINYVLGALALARKAFERLSGEHQQLLLEVAQQHLAEANRHSRADNEEALRIMREEGVVQVHPLAEEVASFRQLVTDSTPELVGKAFSRDAYDRVLRHLADFRARPSTAADDD